jgi:hypothetical protein
MNISELTLNQIISTSGDSTLLSYKYENQVLEFTLHHSELDNDILFKVETSELRVLLHDNYVGDTTSKTCFIELLELSKALPVANNQYYLPLILVNSCKNANPVLIMLMARKLRIISIYSYSKAHILCFVVL